MVSIQIDEEVFAQLKHHAIPFVDAAPNDVLRRVLLGGGAISSRNEQQNDAAPAETVNGGRNPKADLSTLQQRGLLTPGQRLHMRDFRGRPVVGAEATVEGRTLSWRGQRYSMSFLTTRFLQDQGYKSKHARGPARWFTAEGKSVMALWEEHLRTQRR